MIWQLPSFLVFVIVIHLCLHRLFCVAWTQVININYCWCTSLIWNRVMWFWTTVNPEIFPFSLILWSLLQQGICLWYCWTSFCSLFSGAHFLQLWFSKIAVDISYIVICVICDTTKYFWLLCVLFHKGHSSTKTTGAGKQSSFCSRHFLFHGLLHCQSPRQSYIHHFMTSSKCVHIQQWHLSTALMKLNGEKESVSYHLSTPSLRFSRVNCSSETNCVLVDSPLWLLINPLI